MKKFLTYLSVFILAISTCLVGCNLVSRDNNAFYSQIVAKAGDVEVTYEELYRACRNSGSSSLTQEQVTKICQDLLDEKLYIHHFEEAENIKLTEQEINYIYSQVYKSINDTLYLYEQMEGLAPAFRQYSFEQLLNWGLISAKTETEDALIYENYAGAVNYTLEDGFTVNLTFNPLETLDYRPVFEFTSDETDESIKSAARISYFNDLRETAKFLGRDDLSNDALLQGEIDRIYKIYSENALVLKINYERLKTSADALGILNESIFDELKELIANEKQTLTNRGVTNAEDEQDGSIGNISSIKEIESLLAYFPTVISDNFFKVAHIVILNGNAEAKAEKLTNVQSEIDALLSSVDAAETHEEIAAILEAQGLNNEFLDDSETLSLIAGKSHAKASIVLKYIQAEIEAVFTNIDGAETKQALAAILEAQNVDSNFLVTLELAECKALAKQKVFLNYIKEYSDDGYNLSVEYLIYRGDTSGINSSNEDFVAAAKTLGENYTFAQAVHIITDAKTDYSGTHLIMNLGAVCGIADENSSLLDDEHEFTSEEKAEILRSLISKGLKFGNNKTVYHVCLENVMSEMKLFEDNYNTVVETEKNLIAERKQTNKIYTDRMKDLWA